MKIQLLSFPGCPHAAPAREALREALRSEGVGDPVEEIDVSRDDAPAWARGWGSPTILVDGRDVMDDTATCSGMSCRVYAPGSLSVQRIRDRLRAARGPS